MQLDQLKSRADLEEINSILLRVSTITFVILVLAAFWVPIDVDYNDMSNLMLHRYYDADLFTRFAPRALLGTVARTLHLNLMGFIFLRQLFQALWLFLIVFQLAKSMRLQEGSSSSSILEVSALSFLFGFNTVVFTTNGYSGFIDVVPYALV